LKKIKGLDKNEIYEQLKLLNKKMYSTYAGIIGEDVFTEEVEYDITKNVQLFYYKYNNTPPKKFPSAELRRAIWNIRNNYENYKSGIKTKRKVMMRNLVEPFVLGLIKNATLYDCCIKMQDYMNYVIDKNLLAVGDSDDEQ